MTFSRERKVYAGLLGLGLLALFVDRALLSPADAGAASPEPAAPAPVTKPAPATPPANAAAPAPTGPTFTERIAAASLSPDARNPFQPPESWPKVTVVETPTGPAPTDFSSFFESHKLTAIVWAPDKGAEAAIATINGIAYRLGDEIDGFRITAIDASGVEFLAPTGTERRRCELPQPAPTQRGTKISTTRR